MSHLAIVIPTLNEGALIDPLLQRLAPLRAAGHQVIVSDGGSDDGSCEAAVRLADHLVSGSAGRAAQMNRGALLADAQWLWFVHADTAFQTDPLQLAAAISASAAPWGRFEVRLDAAAPIYRLIEWLMNRRSCLSGIATGDQGIFVRRSLFERLGGFPEQPLMEDIELSRRLRRIGRPDCRRERLLTSARRWQRNGVLRTVLLMWRLRLAYFLGVSPQRLAAHYRQCNSPTRVS